MLDTSGKQQRSCQLCDPLVSLVQTSTVVLLGGSGGWLVLPAFLSIFLTLLVKQFMSDTSGRQQRSCQLCDPLVSLVQSVSLVSSDPNFQWHHNWFIVEVFQSALCWMAVQCSTSIHLDVVCLLYPGFSSLTAKTGNVDSSLRSCTLGEQEHILGFVDQQQD